MISKIIKQEAIIWTTIRWDDSESHLARYNIKVSEIFWIIPIII